MEEQMGRRFIRVDAVLLLLLFVLGAGQELKHKAAEEQGERTSLVNAGTLGESGQDAERIAQDRNDIVVEESGSVDERGQAEGIEQYYGTYRITEFWPTAYYRALKYDTLPEQEADMMLGRIVEIGEDQLITYDSFLWTGHREGGYAFWGNYLIEEIFIPHPQYKWESLDPNTKWYEEMEYHNIGDVKSREYYDVIEGRISIQVAESWYEHEYYVMRDGIIMYSWLTGQYFYLEKLDAKPDRALPQNELSDDDMERILQELYGTYTVKKFLPTKFYPALDPNGDIRLPQEEADMMIGKEIVIEEDLFVTYDNERLPNSWFVGCAMDEFVLEAAEISNPDYRLKIQFRDEIYGLRDEMLPEELVQDTYIRINVFPGYGSRMDWSETLPQLYLLEDGRMIMYAMGEYFLIEQKSDRESEMSVQDENGSQEDLSDLEMQPSEVFEEGAADARDREEIEVYRDVLEEYEQAIGEDADEVYVAGEWKYVYDVLYYAGKRRGILYYSLENLSDHDNRELIIGILDNGEYIPYIVYGDWGDGIVELCISEDHEMRIYEGGVIELRLEGVFYSVIGYYQLGEEVIIESLEKEVGEDGEITGYIRRIFLDRYHTVEEEITEEEYLEIIEQYTAVPVELEWRPLKGF